MRTFLSVVAFSSAAIAMAPPAHAQERYLGEIFILGGNFCPRYSIPAHGQLMPISRNQALFSLFGTTYGGDGRTTFGVPDLRGRSPIGAGTGPGLTQVRLGQKLGAETVTQPSGAGSSSGQEIEIGVIEPSALNTNAPRFKKVRVHGKVQEGQGSYSTANNRPPQLVLQYCIATSGIFPSRP